MDPCRPDRMPVLVLSGFLGAGKTTFLNALLATPDLRDTLVLVNEFGDAGLDGLFLEADAAEGSGLLVEELTSGCLCCTLQGPLVQTLEDLLRARDNGRIAPFRQLVIETTGLADPAPILGAFARHPYLSLRYLVGGIVTVVDAAQPPDTLDATPEATAQVAVADMLALSKTDLVDADTLARLEAALGARNPHAPCRATPTLAADTRWLTELLEQAAPVGVVGETHGHEHGHDQHNHHGHHQHAHSVVLVTDNALSPETLAMIMDLLAMNLPGDLLRVKGIAFVRTDTGIHPWAVHAAGPLQHPPRPLSDAAAARLPDQASRIVVITRTDQGRRITELFEACLRQNRA